MTEGPAKEHWTNKPPPTGRFQERSKGDTTWLTISQNPSLCHPSWLNKACTTRKDSESEWLAKDNPETNPISIKPKTASQFCRAVLPGSLTLLLSPPGCSFPIKSLTLSAHVSPQTIHFRVLDKSPVSGPGRGPPSSVQFSCWVVSDSLWPHGPEHARPPCPLPTPLAYSNSCPLSQWCHLTILSSVIPFSSCPQSFPASGSFQVSQIFASGGQSIRVSASTSVLPMNI